MHINIPAESYRYKITHEEGALQRAGTLLDLNRKVMIVTDDGVPESYAETLAAQCDSPAILTLPKGEPSKNIENYQQILQCMLFHGFSRSDCVVALGGGMCGDMSAFAASTYMRGIDFYNIPTTVLSMVDSSIGGKTAIDFGGVKNVVGTFCQPKAVLIDPTLLDSLDQRQISAGLAEVIKMAATCDEELFCQIEESTDLKADLGNFIESANLIKKSVVEEDPKEQGLRKVLNFGHTLGHAIESSFDTRHFDNKHFDNQYFDTQHSNKQYLDNHQSEYEGRLLHGECVSIGMTFMCSEEVRQRLIPVLKKYVLPTELPKDMELSGLAALIAHDKKAGKNGIRTVWCNQIGSFEFRNMTVDEIIKLISP